LRNRLSKLGAKGMIDPKTLRKFDDASVADLAKYLREHRGPGGEARTPDR